MRKMDRCSGYEEGYEEGYEDGQEDAGDANREDARLGELEAVANFVSALLEEVDVRRRGASLPHAIYSDTMTLDEIEQMIRRVK